MTVNILDYQVNVIFLAGLVVFLISLIALIVGLVSKDNGESAPDIKHIERAASKKKKRSREERADIKSIESNAKRRERREEKPKTTANFIIQEWQKDILLLSLNTEIAYAREEEGGEANILVYQPILETLEGMTHWELTPLIATEQSAPLLTSYIALTSIVDPQSFLFSEEDGGVYNFDDIDYGAFAVTLDALNAQYEQFDGDWFSGFTTPWPLTGKSDREQLIYGKLIDTVEFLYKAIEETLMDADNIPIGLTQEMVELDLNDVANLVNHLKDGTSYHSLDQTSQAALIYAILFVLTSSVHTSIANNTNSIMTPPQVSLVRLLAEVAERRPYEDVLNAFDFSMEE